MATIIIPTRTDVPHYRFTTELEGRQYGFEFRWNERAGAWFLALSDAEGDVIGSGIRVRTGSALTTFITDARKPPGRFAVVDTAGKGKHAGASDLGARVLVYYTESADV
jgi:hypothetical protein